MDMGIKIQEAQIQRVLDILHTIAVCKRTHTQIYRDGNNLTYLDNANSSKSITIWVTIQLEATEWETYFEPIFTTKKELRVQRALGTVHNTLVPHKAKDSILRGIL